MKTIRFTILRRVICALSSLVRCCFLHSLPSPGTASAGTSGFSFSSIPVISIFKAIAMFQVTCLQRKVLERHLSKMEWLSTHCNPIHLAPSQLLAVTSPYKRRRDGRLERH